MSRAPHLTLALAAVLALDGCGGSEAPGASQPPNLILVSIDSLRPDHLGCYGHGRSTSPFIDSLAERGARFHVCEVEGRVAGMVDWEQNFIWALHVHPDLQRRGVGAADARPRLRARAPRARPGAGGVVNTI